MKAEIKVTVEIAGKSVDLSESDARALHAALNRLFGETGRNSWKWDPYWFEPPYKFTCDINSDAWRASAKANGQTVT